MTPRLVVVGAGPAGIGAAVAAAGAGLDVTVIDAFDAPGGQVYRPLPRALVASGPQPGDHRRGEALRRRFAAARLTYLPRTRVWHAGRGLAVEAVGPEGPSRHLPDALVLATGAIERVIPFDGWTLPGVVGLAGATIMLKADRAAPGNLVVVAGRGPLLAAVAAGVLKAGARVAAVVDANAPADWLATAPRMLAQPDQLGLGLTWIAALRRARVPVLFGHRLRRIVREGEGLVAEAVPVAGGEPRRFGCDSVAVGDGLAPDVALSRLLGLAHREDRLRGGLVPDVDPDGRTSRAGVYVTGDAAGIAGAVAAHARGEIAGLAAARDLGLLSAAAFARASAAPRARLLLGDVFAGASRRLMAVSASSYADVAPETLVCRCEDVPASAIVAAVADGAGDIDQVKAWTRCGMGPCQGRFCGTAVAAVAARHLGPATAVSRYTSRPPVRPVTIAELIGDGAEDGAPR